MSGYRQSSFDPNAGGEYGAPARPYNWVQWTGVALALVGVGFDLVYLGGRSGFLPQLLDSPSLGIPLPLLGSVLVTSRRDPAASPPAFRDLLGRRWLLLTLIILAAVLGAVLAILTSKGA